MELNLDSTLAEVRQWLDDADAVVWSEEVLTGCLRQALAGLQRVYPLKITIAGLDGALVTILADEMPVLLVRLACVHAWQTRLMQRSELFQLDAVQASHAVTMLEQENHRLQQELENLRLSYLQRSSTLPYLVWPEDPQAADETAE
jgi:hypothetical protein